MSERRQRPRAVLFATVDWNGDPLAISASVDAEDGAEILEVCDAQGCDVLRHLTIAQVEALRREAEEIAAPPLDRPEPTPAEDTDDDTGRGA